MEVDPDRHTALQMNIGDVAVLADNRGPLPEHVFDADVIDFDAYGHPAHAIYAHRNQLANKLIFVTVELMTFRFNWKSRSHMITVARKYGQKTDKEVVTNKGRGICEAYVTPFVQQVTGRPCELVEALTFMPHIERACIRID